MPPKQSPLSPGKNRRVDAYAMIKKAILTGEFEPGTQLIESQLAEWCQVSRTPIREALTRLEKDGLLDRSDRGLVVHESSADEILDTYEVRIVLEATAARTAAERRTANDLVLMRMALQRMEAADQTADDEMFDAINDFHSAVWRASHNKSLTDLLERLSMHLRRLPGATLYHEGRWTQAIEEHRQILHAIEMREGDRAADLANQHFVHSRDIRLEMWSAQAQPKNLQSTK